MNATRVSCSRRWLLILALALWPAVARAEAVLVLPASGSGISPDIIQSARALFVTRLAAQAPQLTIIDRDRPPTEQWIDGPTAMLLAVQARAQAVIVFDLRREQAITTLTVTGVGVPQGERLFQHRQRTTLGPEMMPSLIDGAVTAAMIRQGAQPQACPEVKPAEPRQTFFGARAGVRIPRNRPGPTDTALTGIGVFVVRELPRLFVQLGLTHNSADRGDNDDRGNVTAFGLGLYLPFTAEATAPYLGASLGWQHSRFGGQGADGFVVGPALGWSWRRKQSLGLRIEAGAFYNLYDERGVDRLIPGSAQPYRSWGFDLWVATWL